MNVGSQRAAAGFVVILFVVDRDAGTDRIVVAPELFVRRADYEVAPDRRIGRCVRVDADGPHREQAIALDERSLRSTVRVDPFAVGLGHRRIQDASKIGIGERDRRGPRVFPTVARKDEAGAGHERARDAAVGRVQEMDAVDVGAVDDHADDIGVIGTPERDTTPFRVPDLEVLDAHVVVRVDDDQRVVDAARRKAARAARSLTIRWNEHGATSGRRSAG